MRNCRMGRTHVGKRFESFRRPNGTISECAFDRSRREFGKIAGKRQRKRSGREKTRVHRPVVDNCFLVIASD